MAPSGWITVGGSRRLVAVQPTIASARTNAAERVTGNDILGD
jgi:hypothetical protein